MNTLKRYYEIKLKGISLSHIREIYNEIDWNERLIGIRGARGVGKSTLMLQRIKKAFPDKSKALYVSLDNIWFGNHNILELAEMALNEGITHLFLDEVHKFKGWQQQIKNVYDIFSSIKIVFTGSSLLEIDNSISDLSRRCRLYDMHGLSFREYLNFEGNDFNVISLDRLLYEHRSLSIEISEKIDVLKSFNKYIRFGYYPFYLEESRDGYLVRVNNIVRAVIENDIPAVENVEYLTLMRCKQIISILASQSPSNLSIKNTSELMGVTHSQLLKILSLLDRSHIIRLLFYKTEKNQKALLKPQKVLFNNTSIMVALEEENIGKARETFVASMLSPRYTIGYPKKGDILIENRYLLEVGGKRKSFEQIADMPDSFLVVDDTVVGMGNKIPIWLFGFLY